jgi:hypothetical protein
VLIRFIRGRGAKQECIYARDVLRLMGMSLPCRLFLHSYFFPSHLAHRWCSQHHPWCVDMLFVWSSTLYLATLCGSYCVGMLPEVVYDTAFDMLVFGLFFGVSILLEFFRVLLAHKDAWEWCWEVSKKFKLCLFFFFFSSYGTLDILLDALGALDNAMGAPGFWHFFLFIYLLG